MFCFSLKLKLTLLGVICVSSIACSNIFGTYAAWIGSLVVISFLIIFALDLLGTLSKAVKAMTSISSGIFSFRINLDRRDELGSLCRVIDKTSEILNQTLEVAAEASGNTSSGFIRSRIDDTKFQNGFKQIIINYNMGLDSVTKLFDALPSPVMIRDRNRNIRFLNNTGTLGLTTSNQAEGKKCNDHFKTEDCKNESCACDKAFISKNIERSTTTAQPAKDLSLEIDYIAVPYGDDAVVELVIDITQIKKIQKNSDHFFPGFFLSLFAQKFRITKDCPGW